LINSNEAKRILKYSKRLKSESSQPGFLKKLGVYFIVVWIFMTRIPLPKKILPSTPLLPSPDAMIMMPLVGGVLALTATLPAWILAEVVPQSAAAWISCGFYTILGWSLHLDGWGDLWDGIGSGRRGEAMRAIMKDSRMGTFGVVGLILALSTRAALLSVIGVDKWLCVCIVSGGVARFAAVVTAYAGEYPWGAGIGRDTVQGFKGYQLFCAFIASCLLFPFAPSGWTIGMAASSLAAIGLAMWTNKNLGGTNGDVLGASAVLSEILTLTACAIQL
jgi:adenosylcobinamide-GDP ribazoletransferase